MTDHVESGGGGARATDGAGPATGDANGHLRLVAVIELPAGHIDAVQRYEDAVLALLGRHGGRVERRLRTADGATEVHLLCFPDRVAYESYLADPERAALRGALGEAAPNGRVLEVDDVEP